MKAIVKVKTIKKWYDMEYVEVKQRVYEDEDKEFILNHISRDVRDILNPRDIEIEFIEEG